jgi:D-alanyl-lipoteichoic acid acyltransferase DltB (MBOAT superfamily)
MVFNSTAFAVFFIAFLFLYWTVNKRFSVPARNTLIIAASYLFYGWWDWRFLGLIAFSSAADYFIGLQLGKAENHKRRKILLGISLGVNLGVLGFFKYFNFFSDTLAEALHLLGVTASFPLLHIILPVGISFYTFQTLSYTLDVYNKKISPTRDALQFFAFVSFFPQLVAGPIERASHLLPQFSTSKSFSRAQTVKGLRLMLWGFFKKIVIADNAALLVDAVYSAEETPTGFVALAAVFLSVNPCVPC